MSSDIEFVLESTVRGFHVYRADYLRAVWTSFRTETVRLSHLGPWPRWRNLPGWQWSFDWRLSLFLLDLRLHNVVVALDTNRGWTCAHIYVRIHTCRIIRDPNNSRSWNFDHNNLNNSRSLKKIFIFGIANYFNQYGSHLWRQSNSILIMICLCCTILYNYRCIIFQCTTDIIIL